MVYRFYRNNQCKEKDLVYTIKKTGQNLYNNNYRFEATEGFSRIGLNYLKYRGTKSLQQPNKTVVGDYLEYTEAAAFQYLPNSTPELNGSAEIYIYPKKDERYSSTRDTISKIEGETMTWTWGIKRSGYEYSDLPGFLENDEVFEEKFTKVK